MVRRKNFVHLFTSNAIPQALEVASIQQAIDGFEARISNLKSQIQALEDQVREHRVLLSPMRRMPPEILGEIFQFIVPGYLDEETRSIVTNLSLVCKTWYYAAQLTHRLWSRVSISKDTLPVLSPKKMVAWLGRARSPPRSLSICASDEDHPCRCATNDSTRCPLSNQSLIQLLTEGPSLDHLSIFCDAPRCFQRLLDSIAESEAAKPRSWDSIKSLGLSISSRAWRNSTGPESLIFTHIPKSVTSFQLYLPCAHVAFSRGLPEQSRMAEIPFPNDFLQRLTSFTIKCNWHGTQIFSALVHCVNVKTLTLDFNADASATDLWPADDPTVEHLTRVGLHLPQLRTLCMHRVPSTAIKFFEVLHTPSLEKLEIYNPRGFSTARFYEQLKTSVKVWLQRDHALYHLSLRHASFHSDEILQSLLAGFPSLTHLTIECPRFTGISEKARGRRDVFTALNGDETLPRLEYLELLNMSCDNISFGKLSPYLMTRRLREELGEDCVAIKQLTLTFEEGQDPVSQSYRHQNETEELRNGTVARVDFSRRQWKIRSP